MELQQLFDTVSTHLLTQNRQSRNIFNNCVFHSNDGAKCAIGCLIPEDAYHPMFELTSFDGEDDRIRKAVFPVIGESTVEKLELLDELQCLHDEALPEEWTKALQNLAIKEGLTFTPLPEGVTP